MQVKYAHIGGSATWNLEFSDSPYLQVVKENLTFDTPFGRTVPMKLLKISSELTVDHEEHLFWDVNFHGWDGLSPYDDTPEERIFWVFQKSGVKYILADGTVAGVNYLLNPGDIVIPDDFIDYTKRCSQIGRFTKDIVRSEKIVCPHLSKILYEEAKQEFDRVFDRGVYGVYECPRLESAAESRKFYNDHCDVIGHTMMPEAILARAIGACYAPCYLVSGNAVGLFRRDSQVWEDHPEKMCKVLIRSLAAIEDKYEKEKCNCELQRIALESKVEERIYYTRKGDYVKDM